MPPWAARQWLVLRRPPLDSGCRRLRAQALLSSPLRLYSTPVALRGVNSAIIIPSNVAKTQPWDLLQNIIPVKGKHLTRDLFTVFLVTPSFAPWLLDDDIFVRTALGRVYRHMGHPNSPQSLTMHNLCAVVDKLPAPKPIANVMDVDMEVYKQMVQPPVRESGHEGIAYVTLPLSASALSTTESAQEKAAISLVIAKEAALGHVFADTLRFPLANTVFQTGSPTTMIYSIWERGRESNSLTLKTKQHVTHHGIEIDQGISALSVPLVPLSIPRQVIAGMGNILRQVVGPDNKPVPASQELEGIVPRYFKARGEPSQATSVWALVMNEETLSDVKKKLDLLLEVSPKTGDDVSAAGNVQWENLWRRNPPSWSALVPEALASGARLHRVLSGGGGWGKKAGLLSLDPVAVTEDSISSDDFDSSDGLSDISSALQQVVNEGEYIQFFISPSISTPADIYDENDATLSNKLDNSLNLWGWEFGTIPSTLDSLPIRTRQEDAVKSNSISVFRHSFGALAEGGIVINRKLKRNAEDSFRTIRSSTVDVPFSRFSVLNVNKPKKKKELIQGCLTSKTSMLHRDLINDLYGKEYPPLLGLQLSKHPTSKLNCGLGINLPTKNLQLHNVETHSPSIRFVQSENTEMHNVLYGSRKISMGVRELVFEYRDLMHAIQRRSGQGMDLTVKRYSGLLRETRRIKKYVLKLKERWSRIMRTLQAKQKVEITLIRNFVLKKAESEFDMLESKLVSSRQTLNTMERKDPQVALGNQLAHAADKSEKTLVMLRLLLQRQFLVIAIRALKRRRWGPLQRVPIPQDLLPLRMFVGNLSHGKYFISEQDMARRLFKIHDKHDISSLYQIPFRRIKFSPRVRIQNYISFRKDAVVARRVSSKRRRKVFSLPSFSGSQMSVTERRAPKVFGQSISRPRASLEDARKSLEAERKAKAKRELKEIVRAWLG